MFISFPCIVYPSRRSESSSHFRHFKDALYKSPQLRTSSSKSDLTFIYAFIRKSSNSVEIMSHAKCFWNTALKSEAFCFFCGSLNRPPVPLPKKRNLMLTDTTNLIRWTYINCIFGKWRFSWFWKKLWCSYLLWMPTSFQPRSIPQNVNPWLPKQPGGKSSFPKVHFWPSWTGAKLVYFFGNLESEMHQILI